MPRKEMAALRREVAALQEHVRAKLCTCGKSQAPGEPRTGVRIFSPKSCAEERDDELVIQRIERERCPAMHPDGDAEPVIIRFNVLSCQDPGCECHLKPDHRGCPACDSDYFNKHRDPISGAFRLDAGRPATGAAPEETAAEPAGTTQASEVVPEPQPAPERRSPSALGAAAANAKLSAWTGRQLPGPARDHVIDVGGTRARYDDGPQLRPLPTTSFCGICKQHVLGHYCAQCGVETDQ